MSSPFADLVTANRAYASTFALGELRPQARRGLAVLTCIDSRIEPLSMLGLAPGDAKIVRNAGARVSDDALRSLVLAANLLDVHRIMVVAHTDCAMADITDADVRARLAEHNPGGNFAAFEPCTAPDQRAVLRTDVERLLQSPLLPAGTVVAGFLYDVRTGLLEAVVD